MGSVLREFSASPQRVVFKGLLFDMDGTIIDSTDAIVKHWHKLGEEIGVDPNVILQTSHGRRSIDVLRIIAPEKANWEYIKHMEGLLPKLYGDDAVEIPGARSLLDSLITGAHPWAIVTSGTSPLVTGWLNVLNLPIPEHLISAEDVPNGKPDPACYNLGKLKLNLHTTPLNSILVFEDSPAGIQAGKAAGCKVLAVVTTHTIEQVLEAGADWVVQDLSSVKVIARTDGSDGAGVELEISNALV
ncbi:Dl-glycerol-3-phosphatase-like protein [Sclerotinia borealis F-4128]|uniref:Dl-glycerol-3-phosphatase-like protein n=1 Tax=Sclerotinia borealis (strain F-4128) TaxID=1432307 RepID=W9CDH7_SCLBF|nr:Dl-glycerol-3-phosphatase-like protein [Sclerotinia borealis F-4128]